MGKSRTSDDMTDPLSPHDWRAQAGLSLAKAAEAAGIAGKNPARTYGRYEAGETPVPAEVVEAIQNASGGAVTPASWHQVRLGFLRANGGAAPRAAVSP